MLLTDTATHQLQPHTNQSRLRVLVLCTGNSARSIMAEAIFNTVGAPLFQAFSAGSCPTGKVNPLALEQIGQLALPGGMMIRSKSWEEFTTSDAPELDVVLTVCDSAASEACPTFAGNYHRVHWSFPDPAGASAIFKEEQAAFATCFQEIKKRVASIVRVQHRYSSHKALIQLMESYQ